MCINWDVIPEGYNWVAKDKSGDVYAFKNKPEKGFSCFVSEMGTYFSVMGVSLSNIPWEDSLMERPPKDQYSKEWKLYEGGCLPKGSKLLKDEEGNTVAYKEPLKEPEVGEEVYFLNNEGTWSYHKYPIIKKTGGGIVLKGSTVDYFAYKYSKEKEGN